MSERAGAKTTESAGSHPIYVSRPEDVAAIIKTAAQGVTSTAMPPAQSRRNGYTAREEYARGHVAVGPRTLEVLVLTADVMSFWSGKRVLLTGHTGFMGAWLCACLIEAGARVTGLALASRMTPSLFDQLGLAAEIDHRLGDIRDAEGVARLMRETQPDVVFHLAAQALVLEGYREPLATWVTNVMGTAHVLDALRTIERPCAVVLVTTDKVYRNNEWEFGYRETDHLGGHDPYSASKAAAELAIESWRKSFLSRGLTVRIAAARAGNVIGGGDWSENRIVPDIVRALSAQRVLEVRNPNATRPWQHVLEPLAGYMLLAEHLYTDTSPAFQDAFNFGPASESERKLVAAYGAAAKGNTLLNFAGAGAPARSSCR
jgi:CDP-glucose 4,6-dehydratase